MTIYVGPNEKKWVIHEGLLTRLSSFFRAAFRSEFQEAEDGVLRLPEDDPRAFEIFFAYAYSHSLGDIIDKTKSLPSPNGAKFTERDYLSLYVLASKYLMEGLQNEVVDALYLRYRNTELSPTPQDVEYLYQHTDEGSKMRQLLAYRLAVDVFGGNSKLPDGWDQLLKDNLMISHDMITLMGTWGIKVGKKLESDMIYKDRMYFHTHKP